MWSWLSGQQTSNQNYALKQLAYTVADRIKDGDLYFKFNNRQDVDYVVNKVMLLDNDLKSFPFNMREFVDYRIKEWGLTTTADTYYLYLANDIKGGINDPKILSLSSKLITAFSLLSERNPELGKHIKYNQFDRMVNLVVVFENKESAFKCIEAAKKAVEAEYPIEKDFCRLL
jgi:hypothetical protein